MCSIGTQKERPPLTACAVNGWRCIYAQNTLNIRFFVPLTIALIFPDSHFFVGYVIGVSPI